MSLSSGTMSVGVLAIFSGLLGAYGLRAVLLSEPKAKPEAEQLLTVPLATADLPAGRVIRFGDVGIHRLTRKQMAERKLANPAVMTSAEQVIGRRTRLPIKQGEPFLTTSLHLEGSPASLSELLKPGFRAIHVKVPDLLGGTAEPGTLVDVLFHSTARKSPNSKALIPEATVTLMEGVEVLTVERPKAVVVTSNNLDLRRANGNNAPVTPPTPTVSLAVTLEQANILRTVESRGTISLVARAADDVPVPGQQVLNKKFTLEDLLSLQPPKPPFTTEIYRGASKQIRVFGDDELERALSLLSPQPRSDMGSDSNDGPDSNPSSDSVSP